MASIVGAQDVVDGSFGCIIEAKAETDRLVEIRKGKVLLAFIRIHRSPNGVRQGVVWLEADRDSEISHGMLVCALPAEENSASDEGISTLGREPECSIEVRQRVIEGASDQIGPTPVHVDDRRIGCGLTPFSSERL
jgi:hypothetical protein